MSTSSRYHYKRLDHWPDADSAYFVKVGERRVGVLWHNKYGWYFRIDGGYTFQAIATRKEAKAIGEAQIDQICYERTLDRMAKLNSSYDR